MRNRNHKQLYKDMMKSKAVYDTAKHNLNKYNLAFKEAEAEYLYLKHEWKKYLNRNKKKKEEVEEEIEE